LPARACLVARDAGEVAARPAAELANLGEQLIVVPPQSDHVLDDQPRETLREL